MSKELKAFTVTISLGNPNGELTDKKVCLKSEVDALLAEKDAEIARLNDKALQYKVLDKEHCRDLNTQEKFFAAKIRRLSRALYRVCAMWAQSEIRRRFGGYPHEENGWFKMKTKCLKKAEEYK